jgi:IclR family KDG regulon transcriptional repressor
MTKSSLQTVERAFELLSLFSPARQDLSVKEASNLLGLPMSTTHRLLASLKTMGVLEQDVPSGKYSLSLRLWEIGSLALKHLDIKDVARPFLEQLSKETAETVFLSVIDGQELLYLDRVDADQDLRLLSRVGSRRPAYCMSSGLAILAFSPSSVVDAIVAKGLGGFTALTITDPEIFSEELARIRQRGYAVNVEGRTIGVSGIAAPVLNSVQRAVGAISISGPSARLTRDRFPALGKLVCQCAQQIAASMGFVVP